MIVYKAINQVNGKVYIGQTTTSFKRRKSEHIWRANSGSDSHFHNAIRKHGADNFVWMIINKCYDIDTLNQLEKHYIKYYDSMNREIGYNMHSGGLNYEVSDECRQKMVDNHTKPMLGRHHTDETKKKCSESKLGDLNPNYGKPLTDRNGNLIGWQYRGVEHPWFGRKHKLESIDKMRQSQLGRTASKATKKKHRNRMKKLWADPKWKEKQSKAIKLGWEVKKCG